MKRRARRGEFDPFSHPDPQLGPFFGLLFSLKQRADRLGITAALGKGRMGKLALFLYDVTGDYLEGGQNELGEYGTNHDGRKGKQQIVIRLLADGAGEPLAVLVFAGNTVDPATVAEQIRVVKEQFGIEN